MGADKKFQGKLRITTPRVSNGLASVLSFWRLNWILILNLYLLSPILIYDLRVFEGFPDFQDKVAVFNLLVSILVLATFHFLFRRPWKFHLLIFPLYVVVATELFLIWQFNSRLTTSYIAVILGEFEHAADFFLTFAPRVAAAVGLFILGYGFLLWKSRSALTERHPRWAIATLAVLLLIYAGTTARQMKVIPADFAGAWNDVLAHDKNSPFGIFSQGYVAYHLHLEAERNYASRKNFVFGARKTHQIAEPEIHVLVIGETSRPDHWSINGYPRKTSPRLEKTDRLVSFSNAIAEIALTRLSVPLILSRANLLNVNQRASERSIISAFKEAGYETYWLSTQQWDRFTSEINHYASEADYVRYVERKYDEVLLNELDDVIAKIRERTSKVFIVLHTQGSHIEFQKRYPDAFKVFPQDSARSRKEWLVDTYDNSIVYSDHFLSEVTVRLQPLGIPATMFYVSDHGENLMDDDRKLQGHFHNNEYDLPIAMFFWASAEYDRLYPDVIQNARLNRKKAISTSNVFSSLLDLANITVEDGYYGGQSIFSPDLKETTRLVKMGNSVENYDEKSVSE